MTNQQVQLNNYQALILQRIKDATGRQIVDRSIATKEVQRFYAVELDSALEMNLLTYKSVRWNVGTPAHPVFTTTAMLYLTKEGRKSLRSP